MDSRTLDCNQSETVVHADWKIVFGRHGLGATDDRRVILSSVLDAFIRDNPRSASEWSVILFIDIRYWGKNGKHLLALSFSGFDPKRTSASPSRKAGGTAMIRLGRPDMRRR
jgi:hypothetical protein